MIRTICALVSVLVLAACSSTGGVPSPEEMAAASAPEQEYRIGIGDQLFVSVWQHGDLSVSVTVLPDGDVSLPLVDSVQAAGLTEEELAAVVTERLSEYVRTPEVTVTVQSPASASFTDRVRVTGAVNGPTSIEYRSGMTVLDLVLTAGGPNDFAAANRTKLYRSTPDGIKVFPVYLDDILKKGKLETNYPLQPADVVTVPERLF